MEKDDIILMVIMVVLLTTTISMYYLGIGIIESLGNAIYTVV